MRLLSRFATTAPLALATVLVTTAGAATASNDRMLTDPATCAATRLPVSTTAALDEYIDPIVGADYQRAFTLDDGRTLWVFQDAFVDDGAGDPALVHNAAVVEDDRCFDVVTGGTEANPAAWIADGTTVPFRHWYWPLGGYQADRDTFVMYLAEMTETGDHYLAHTEPVATAMIEIDLATMTYGAVLPAPDATPALYGWAVVEDESYRYLYGYCYRQFGWSWLGHDECANVVTVARQPTDDFDAALTYWDGVTWNSDPTSAADISPTVTPAGEQRGIDPMQIARSDDGTWIAVTKVGDWYGTDLFFDVAPAPQGPWTTTAVIPDTAFGVVSDDGVNNYFATIVPDEHRGATIAISSNCWEEPACDEYRPTVRWTPDQLWARQQPVEMTDGVFLPLGAELDGFDGGTPTATIRPTHSDGSTASASAQRYLQ